MFDLTALDYIYVGIILVSTIWATIRGGIYETVATLSWVLAAIVARFTSPFLDDLLQSWFKLSDSTVGTLIASYFIVFFAILLIMGFINQKLRDRIQASVMNVTDHTLGVIFGIIRGIFVMGLVYWGMLWYFSDAPSMPGWIENARTRPLMQLTAVKLDHWFIPGEDNRLLMRDMTGTREALEIYHNLINPAVSDDGNKAKPETKPATKPLTPATTSKQPQPAAKSKSTQPAQTSETEETGYRASERADLEKQLSQIKTVGEALEKRAAERDAAAHESE